VCGGGGGGVILCISCVVVVPDSNATAASAGVVGRFKKKQKKKKELAKEAAANGASAYDEALALEVNERFNDAVRLLSDHIDVIRENASDAGNDVMSKLFVSRGRILRRLALYRDAIKDLTEAVNLDGPLNHIALYERAKCHRMLGQRSDALADLDAVTDEAKRRAAASVARSAARPLPRVRWDELDFRTSDVLLGEWAIDDINHGSLSAVIARPSRAGSPSSRAQTARRERSPPAASSRDRLRATVSSARDVVDAKVASAESSKLARKLLLNLKDVHTSDDVDSDAEAAAAIRALHLADDGATRAFSRGILRDPSNAALHLSRAQSLFQKHRVELAARDCVSSLTLTRPYGSTRVMGAYVRLLVALGLVEKARQELEVAAHGVPEDGVVLGLLGGWERGGDDFSQGLCMSDWRCKSQRRPCLTAPSA
jgi:tetratricopeptide (TPR) repeat protein